MEFTTASVAAFAVPKGKSEAIAWDDTLPGFGLRVRSGGSKTWVAQYRLGPQQRRESLGDVRKVKLEDARKIARKRFASVELGVDPRSKNKPRVSLGKAVTLYLEMQATRLRPESMK